MASPRAYAQLTTAEEKGLPSNSAFQGGDVDTVNLQNGNLHISIPIVSSVQRGGQTFKWQFVYDTQAWLKLWVPTTCPTHTCTTSGYYVPEVNPNIQSGWRLTSPFDWDVNFTESPIITCATTSQTYQQETNWTIIDPQGTQHPLPLRIELADNSCLGQTLRGPTLDGSGMVYDSQTSTIYTKDGNQIVRDRNGNRANNNADTLNRNLLTTTTGSTVAYTTPLGHTTTGAQYTNYTTIDSSGSPQVYRVDYQAIDIKSDICSATPAALGGSPPNCTDGGAPTIVPAKLTLPNGKAYVFTYNNNTPGELARLDLPTGASISYSYGDFYQSQWNTVQGQKPNYVGSRSVVKRTVNVDGQSNPWTYTISAVSATVLDPVGNTEVHSFGKLSLTVAGQVKTSPNTYEMGVTYSDAQGNLLKTVSNDYAAEYDPVNNAIANARVIRTTLKLDNGQTTKKETDFETFTYPCVNAGSLCPGTATRMNPTEVREFDYGAGSPGALLRRTDYAYLHSGNQNYLNLNIVDKPTMVTVYDGSGTMAAKTVNEYDNYSHSGQAMQSSNAVQHDAGYGTTFTTRGNLTAVSKWRNTDGALFTTTNQYDDAGNVLSTIDPLGHQTSYSFTDSWASTACAPTGQAAIFPTRVTNAKGQYSTSQYDACTGLLASTTDINGNSTSFSYDFAGRPKQVLFPTGGGTTTYCYSDDPGGSCYSSTILSSTATRSISTSQNTVDTAVYDGLGREKQTQATSDPEGIVYSDTAYDQLGRVLKVSNPYRTGDTEYWTTNGYDGLSRLNLVTKADNSTTSTVYVGNTTTITDEAGKKRQSKTDAIGRLTTVFEDPAGSNFETDYGYNVLGQLLNVTQKGGDSNSANWRTRSFTYDSLGELLCSANPEIGSPLAAVAACPATDTGAYIAGTVRYQYNNDGELVSKTSPLPNQQGTATVLTSYSYDVLHRPLGLAYNDGTAASTFIYDGDTPTGCTAPTLSAFTLKGKMSAMCDASGATAWSYDSMGRTLTEARKIATVTDQIAYSYYLNGAVKTVSYPLSGATNPFVITYNVNAAGRTYSAVGSDGVTYAQVTSTWAQGAPHVSGLGANIQLTNTYNSRLQPLLMTAQQMSPSKTLFSRMYDFHLGAGDNGNLFGVTDGLDQLGLNRPNGSVQYGYDALNRITSAATTGTACTAMPGGSLNWGNSFTIDAWGNLTGKTVTKCSAESLSSSSNNRNQLAAATYDSAGDVIVKDSVSYHYDAEGRVTSGGGTAYTYDGMGERVIKPGKLYWKGVGSTALSETDASDRNPTKYIFFNGARIARIDPGTTAAKYYVADNIGSTALVTDASGNVLNESLFFPYGSERVVSHNDAANNYKFTGKERDPETGLDDFGARYYASNLGRFMTPDWDTKPASVPYANFGDPQTLNLYSYVENEPLNQVDADGHAAASTSPASPSVSNECKEDYTDACAQANQTKITGQSVAQIDDYESAVEFGIGVLRGAASSISFGLVGAPSASDSNTSLAGQAIGTSLIGAAGTETAQTGLVTTGVGLAAELPSAGTSTVVVAAGVAAVGAGVAAQAGALKNGAAIAVAMSKKSGSGGDKGAAPGTGKDRTLEGKTSQVKDIKEAQKNVRAGKTNKLIDSTKKSEQNLDNHLKNIHHLSDVE